MIIIGIDHGYYAIKTRQVSFPSGIIRYDSEPYTCLLYTSRFFILEEMRMGNRKEEILIVALHLFARDGYEAVSVSQIAGELDVYKRQVLYRRAASWQ